MAYMLLEQIDDRMTRRMIHHVLLLVLSLRGASGWGKEGHEIVADIASRRLSDAVRWKVTKVLNGSSLASIANWADKVRFTHPFHWTTPLHYVDIADDAIQGGCPCVTPHREEETHCSFVFHRDCADDMCAVGAIPHFSNSIANTATHKTNLRTYKLRQPNEYNVTTLTESLMFLTHIVGDVHQPLHVSRKSDRGGNSIPVLFFPTTHDDDTHHHKWNLHSVWDEGIIRHAIQLYHNDSQQQFLQSILDHDITNTDLVHEWLACADGQNMTCASSWARESLRLALRWAYADEHDTEIRKGESLTRTYFETRYPIVRLQLAAAGVRLAATLESIFMESNNNDKWTIENTKIPILLE